MKSAAGLVRASCLAAGLIVSPHLARADAAAILKVEITAPAPGSTGTMHYADELRLSAGRSGPLILKSELSSGKLIPVPGPQYRVDDSHVLLLGWSSHGGGMQTIHALLVHLENDHITLQRELRLTTARTASVLVVRSDGPNDVRLGIGEPAEGPHDESDWLLAFGPAREEQLNAGQIRKLPFTAEAKHAADALYAPPFQKTRFPARIAWLSVSASGFALVSQAR